MAVLATGCKSTQANQSTKSKKTNALVNTDDTGNSMEDQTLPLDTSIRKGVLENGMTYYLHNTDVTKDVASYYIIQNVGSILENDEQQGLAHFLEHMAFNGTETFPGKGILNTLQENGLIFGRDINAYTSFDETVYNINNVPTTPEMIDTGLQILRDWSNYLLLTDNEIDAERGVIKEEWRSGQNGSMRVMEATLDTEFGNSKYARRLPIGLMNIVDNFEYKALRDFYHDWYRTDLQAIAIVGDLDLDDMEAKIKQKFSAIPAVENPLKREEETIAENDAFTFDIAMDKEVATSSISYTVRQPKPTVKNTMSYIKESLYNNIITTILNNRFEELAQRSDAPFIIIQSYYGGMARLYNNFGLYIGPKPNMQEEAFALTMNEIQRAINFGFTNSEINRVITDQKSQYENAIAEMNDRPHAQIVRTIQENYLNNEPMLAIKEEYEIAKGLFKEVTPQSLQEQLQMLYTPQNRVMVVTGVKGNKNLTKEKSSAIITAAERNADLKPYEEEAELASLISGIEMVPGRIASETKNSALGFTTLKLSNGINVNYKYVDKNKNEIAFEAISDGGKSLLTPNQLPSADVTPFAAQMSGISDFSATDLQKVLAGKQVMVNFDIGEITESILGSSATKDVETLLQLAHLSFVKPRFDDNGYALMMQNVDNFLIRKSEDLRSKMQDSITISLYGKNHPVKRLFDKEYVADIDLEEMKTVYKGRFANPADFEFFIVGDIKLEDLKPMLIQYIASLPTNETRENWKDNSSSWVQDKIKRDIFMTMEDAKGSVNIELKKEMPYSIKDAILLSALGDILDLRYTQTLREEEGGTYGASAGASLIKEPKSYASVYVTFDSNPELTDKLVGIVYREMDKIKNGTIAQQDLDKTIKAILKGRKDSKNDNDYDMRTMKNFILEGYNMELPENFENIVNGIDKKSIQDIAKRVFTDNKSYQIVFKPKI